MQTLLSNLREFKLSGIVSSLEERLIYAKSNKLSYQELLELLCEDEKNNRRDNRYQKRRKNAKLPTIKRLEDFDFSFQPSIDQRSINDIATCQFIKSKENVILQGDSGTGKTHLAISFALKALEKEYSVFFTTVSDMLYNLHSSKVDNTYHKKIRTLASYDLLILDELGFKQLPKYSSDDLFNVISKRYEQKSTIITTNKEVDKWNDIFDDNMLTKAIVDRIMHYVTMFNIKGKSYRRKKLKREAAMSAPRKVRKNQLVRIRPMQSLTSSIEPTIALQEVTNVMKPVEGTYQAATQVKVLSPEIYNIIEADVFHCTEGSMKGDAMVSHHSLYRGLSPWHDMRWSLRKLGRSSVLSKEYARTSQNRQGLANGAEEVGLTDSTRSIGKLYTGGSGQQWSVWLSTSQINTRRL